MTCGQGGVADAVALNTLPPVQLVDTRGGNTPALQLYANTKRDEVMCVAVCQALMCGTFEVVVVIVRDKDDIQRR